MPIRISRNERWKRVINPLQVKFELIKEQNDPICNRPFLGIRKSDDKIDSVWIGILDINEKRVTDCHQVDLNELEIQFIRSFKFSKNKIIDEDTNQNELDPIFRLPQGCEKEYSYQVCIWFGDDKWMLKIFEYRVRWWNRK